MLLTNTAEGGTIGGDVTAANSGGASGDAWDNVLRATADGGAFIYDDEHARGTAAYKITSATSPVWAGWDSGSVGTLTEAWGRLYLWLPAVPSAELALVRVRSGGSQSARIAITSSGLLILRQASNAAVATSTGTVPTGQWVRIEWHIIAATTNGTIEARVYGSADSETITETMSSSTAALTAAVDEVQYGPVGSEDGHTYWLDDLAATDVDWLGPAAAPAEPEPRFPLDDRYELLLDGTWTDITGYVYDRDPVTITRGRSAEAQTADPATMTLTLNNRDGRFSSRNPTSPWYGILGRNTPIRASLPYGTVHAVITEADDTSQITAPDTAAFGVGDLDVRVDVDAGQWRAGDLAARYVSTTDERSWWFGVQDGLLELIWSPDGTLANRLSASATEVLPVTFGRLAVRATLDVDNGASGYTVTFYTADSLDAAWTQLGDAVTGTATTSVHDGTAGLEVGAVANLDVPAAGNSAIPGRYFGVELRNGIDGTLVADPDFTAQTAGDTSFADDAGNTWTVSDTASIDDRRYRFHGEVATWPTTWAVNRDHHVKITAAGITRRYGKNAPPARSAMYREFANPERQHIVVYWPCEDGTVAQQIAAAGAAAAPMAITGSPTLASDGEWTASDPLPEMATGTFTGTVPAYTATGELSIRMFVFVDENPSSEASLLRVTTSGTSAIWEVLLTTAGGLRTRAWDRDGNSILDHTSAFDMVSRGFTQLDLELSEDGADIDWFTRVIDFINTQTIDDPINVSTDSGTVTGQTLGVAQTVAVGADQELGKVVIGHIAVADDLTAYADTGNAIAAQNGENPTDRLERLCREEGITLHATSGGRAGNSVLCGDQLNKTILELLREAAATDLGILHDARDWLGLAYRSRTSLYNQDPRVTLDYSSGQVAGDLVPVDDDRATVNDLNVKRAGGSAYHIEETTGPLSVAEPDDGGVGRYPSEITISLCRDEQLADQAGWRLHLGTVDEARFPRLPVNLRAPGITDELVEDLLDLDVGDRIVLTGIPAGLPPDDVSLLVQGYTETLRKMGHVIEVNLAPESPWHVGVVERPGVDRVDSDTSTLAADATSTDTSLSVASTGAPWTTDTDDLPMDAMVAGERVTVTAITGTSSPQTFTVTRSVNGVEKAQSSGAAVTIAEPVTVAL